MDERERYDEGMQVRRAVLGDAHVERTLARRDPFNEPFQDLITRYAWGEIWTRPGLPRPTRSLLTLALMVALNRPDEFRLHVRAAFNNGVTREEIREVLMHCAIYAGVPAANSAFHMAEALFAEMDAQARQDDTDVPRPPRYPGPRALADALTRLARGAGGFTRDGPRADVEYRDLGWADASGGMVGAKHIRALGPFQQETGWHWHDMTAHFVIVLRGWIEFRYDGVDEVVRVQAGGSLSQPAGVAHNVVGRSDDMELIEVNLPASYGTFEAGPAAAAAGEAVP